MAPPRRPRGRPRVRCGLRAGHRHRQGVPKLAVPRGPGGYRLLEPHDVVGGKPVTRLDRRRRSYPWVASTESFTSLPIAFRTAATMRSSCSGRSRCGLSPRRTGPASGGLLRRRGAGDPPLRLEESARVGGHPVPRVPVSRSQTGLPSDFPTRSRGPSRFRRQPAGSPAGGQAVPDLLTVERALPDQQGVGRFPRQRPIPFPQPVSPSSVLISTIVADRSRIQSVRRARHGRSTGQARRWVITSAIRIQA